jgi:hypothetical protein
MLLAACGSESTADPRPGSCEAVATSLGKTTRLSVWKPPADCKEKGGGSSPSLAGTEADARTHVECKDPKAKLGIDFAKHQLVVTARSYSPAQVGLDVYDDGKKVTFVSRQRPPCKNDPRPMPGPSNTLLMLASPGPRTFAEASCNVDVKCP